MADQYRRGKGCKILKIVRKETHFCGTSSTMSLPNAREPLEGRLCLLVSLTSAAVDSHHTERKRLVSILVIKSFFLEALSSQ